MEESKAKRVKAPTPSSSTNPPKSEEQELWEKEERILNNPGISNWRKNKIHKERKKRSKGDDNLTKTY